MAKHRSHPQLSMANARSASPSRTWAPPSSSRRPSRTTRTGASSLSAAMASPQLGEEATMRMIWPRHITLFYARSWLYRNGSCERLASGAMLPAVEMRRQQRGGYWRQRRLSPLRKATTRLRKGCPTPTGPSLPETSQLKAEQRTDRPRTDA